ncbi:unnamed protein product, partial [Heterosigma akashiwo]
MEEEMLSQKQLRKSPLASRSWEETPATKYMRSAGALLSRSWRQWWFGGATAGWPPTPWWRPSRGTTSATPRSALSRSRRRRRPRRRVGRAAVAALSGAGVFGVEMFLLGDGGVLLNEIAHKGWSPPCTPGRPAPRPHNSGHYTIEACECDQFENHLLVLGLPLGGTALRVGAAFMLNVLGEEAEAATLGPLRAALAVPGAGIHWYGKPENRKGRKMAHITFTAGSVDEIRERTAPLGLALPGGGGGGGGGGGAAAPLVGVIMGSDSDLPTMRAACDVLGRFGVPFECTIVSAHRTSARMFDYA